MRSIVISDGQNLMDVAVRYYGAAEGIFQLIQDNDHILNINHSFLPGDVVLIDDARTIDVGVTSFFDSLTNNVINTGQEVLVELLIQRGWDSNLENFFFYETNFNADGIDTHDPEIVGNVTRFLFESGAEVTGGQLNTLGSSEGLYGQRQYVGVEVVGFEHISAIRMRQDSIVGEVRLDVLPNLTEADLAFNQIESITVGEWVNQQDVVVELRDNQLNTQAQAQLVQDIATKFNGTTSNLKVGLFNQKNALGEYYLPDSATVQLAVDLYNNHGIEIYLPSALATVTIG